MTGQNRQNWPNFFCKETFLTSLVNNLMVFKKSGHGLEKVVLVLAWQVLKKYVVLVLQVSGLATSLMWLKQN